MAKAYNLNPQRQKNWENFQIWCKANDVSARKGIEDLIEKHLREQKIPPEVVEPKWK